MKKKRIACLLLVAFIALMGFNGLVFAGKCSYLKQLARQLDEINDAHTDLLNKLDDMQDQLDQLQDQTQPTWSKKLPANKRFEVVMNGKAVLDWETGLVWERSPSAQMIYAQAYFVGCNSMAVGGRKGWRLPTIEELASLVDPTQSNPALPAGHPFINVQSDCYWSVNPFALGMQCVNFGDGSISARASNDPNVYVWCVRGGQTPLMLHF